MAATPGKMAAKGTGYPLYPATDTALRDVQLPPLIHSLEPLKARSWVEVEEGQGSYRGITLFHKCQRKEKDGYTLVAMG